jgi:hypothetical protein
VNRTSQSDSVREYARKQYIEPARQRGETRVKIVAGDVHRGLRLTQRVPLVCNALASKEFLETNHLELESRKGPPSGLSTTVEFTYLIVPVGKPKPRQLLAAFLPYLGAGKEVFGALGGAEAFIKAEREAFDRSVLQWPDEKE